MKASLIILLALSLLLPAPAATTNALSFARESAQGGEAFDLGIPSGNADSPYSLALDAARDIAYVYHSSSEQGWGAVSVVNLASRKVERLMRAGPGGYGGPGRLLLTPDGSRLLLQEGASSTLSAINPQTGKSTTLLNNVRDIVLSDDGRQLFVAGNDFIAAYRLADLLAEKTNPVWRNPASFLRIAVNGQRLLAGTVATNSWLALLDTATGTQLARVEMPDGINAVAAGGDGGWGAVTGGERPRLLRYDVALVKLGETSIPYANDLSYDRRSDRFLLGGYRYDEGAARGRPVILAVDGASGEIAREADWPASNAPTIFAAWGEDALLAFPLSGPSLLSILDADRLTAQNDIPMGVRAEEAAVDGDTALYVADDLGRIHVLKLPAGEEIAVWQGSAPLALDAENGRLYANRGAGVVALDLADGSVVAEFGQAGHPAPDPKRDLVYIVDRGVTMYDRSGKKLDDLPSTFPTPKGFSPNPYAYAAQVNPVTGHVAVIVSNGIPGSNGGSFLRIYKPGSDEHVEPAAPHSFVLDVLSDNKGNWYVAYSPVRAQEAIQVLSPDGKELRRLDRRTGLIGLDERADTLYLFTKGKVTRLAASSLTALETLQGPEDLGNLAAAPGSSVVYLLDPSGSTVMEWPIVGSTPVRTAAVSAQLPRDAHNSGLSVVGEGQKRLIIGQFGETFRSGDGKTWQQLLPNMGFTYGHTTAVSPDVIFMTGVTAQGGEGVWRSNDGGATWEWLTGGLTDLAPDGPVLAQSADAAYFLNRRQGLLRWSAAARRWQVVSPAAEGADWTSLALAPDGTLFRSNSGSLERSGDRGATWTKLGPTATTGDVIGFSALYTVTQTVFSAARTDYRFSGVNRSEDAGKTWQPSLTAAQLDFGGYPPELATGFGRTYLLTRPYQGEPLLLRTTDYGGSWQTAPAGTAKGAEHLAVDPLDGRVWLGIPGGVRAVEPDKLRWTSVKAAPQARAVPTVQPTPAPTPTAGPCATTLAGVEAEIDARSLGLGCPRGPNEEVQMARQRFQNGQMIWRGDRNWIYVLYDDGRWEGHGDRWADGEPADDPALTAPEGLQQPVRGFGKVWREELGGASAAVGWALEKEQGLQAYAQDWDYGTVLRFGGEVIVLQSIGTWR